MLHYRPLGAYLYVAVILGSLSVYAQIIDPRFPDYIVDPLVDCPTDGYFTHPRNCSWFYRCHDSENTTGFYRRDYFECAPGTIHSQAIGICFKGTWDNCVEIEIPPVVTVGLPEPKPQPDASIVDCAECDYANFEGCSEFNVCPDANDRSKKVSLWLCSSATYSCEKCSKLSPCKSGEWISSNPPLRRNPWIQRLSTNSKCYPNPYSPEMQCLITDLPAESHIGPEPTTVPEVTTTEVVPATEVPSTEVPVVPEVPILDCAKCDYANFEGCSEFNVCPDANNRSKKVSLWLCSSASYSCKTCSHLTPCKENEWISSNPPLRRNPWVQRLSASSKCYPNPYSPEMQCLITPPKCDDCIVTKNLCQDYEVCPDGVSRVTMNLCKTAIRECESCKIRENVCPEGLYNSQDKQCYPDPSITSTLQCPDESTKAPCISTDCQVSTSSCSNFVFACSGGKSQGSLTICTSAYNVCPSCNIDKVICPSGHFYAIEDATCYLSQEEITLKKCPTPVTPPPAVACDECYISTSRCQPYDVCPEGTAKTTMTLCTTAKRQCYPCESEENVCARGQFYSMDNGLCFKNPESSSMKCSPGHKDKENKRPTLHNIRDSPEGHQKVNSKRDSVIQCSSENLVPTNQWIKEKFCQNYRPCMRNYEIPTHSGIIELCTGFYQCVLSSTDYSWRAVKSKCEGNKLFSFDGEACINEPRDLCRIY